MHLNLSDVAAGGAHAPPYRRGAALERFVFGPRKGTIARQAETRGLLRLPLRVERTRDVFNPSVLSCAGSPGVASYRMPYQQTVCLRRHPIDRTRGMQRPSEPGPGRTLPAATPLKLAPMAAAGPAIHFHPNESHAIYRTGH